MARVPDPRRFTVSIATRIRLAVAGLIAMVLVLLVASAIAQRDLQRVMLRTAGEQIPAIEPMRAVGRAGEALVRVGAELAATPTDRIAAGDSAEIERHAGDLAGAMQRLAPHDPHPMALQDLDGAVAAYARAAMALVAVADRSRAHLAVMADREAAFAATHLRLTNGIDALIDGPMVNLMAAVDQTLGIEDRATAEAVLRDMLWQGVGTIRRLGEAKAEANLLYATAGRVFDQPQRRRIGEAETRFDIHARRLRRALEERDHLGLAGLPALGEALIDFGSGGQGVFGLGRGAVALDREAATLRMALEAAAPPVRDGLTALYERTNRSMAEADQRAMDTLLRDQMLLGGAMALVLVLAILFGWIYVSRSVAAPLRRLGQAATAIEAGHVDVPLPRQTAGEIGQLTRALTTLRDRSRELVRLRLRMIHGEDDSAVQDRLRVQLLTGLVDDIRVPVARMNRSVHLLRSMTAAPVAGAARDCLDQLDGAAADVLYRLEEGIDLAAFWNGEVTLQPVEVDLVDVIEDAVAALDLSPDDRARCVGVGIDAGLTRVRVDAVRLRHMLVQLVAGGIAAGGRVTLDVGMTPVGGIAIAATDRGPPLAVREVERRLLALDRFGVTAPADDRRARLRAIAPGPAAGAVVSRSMAFGRGLGLLLCEAVVTAHGGGMTIDSAPGRGTRITCALPLSCVLAGRRSRAGTLHLPPDAQQA